MILLLVDFMNKKPEYNKINHPTMCFTLTDEKKSVSKSKDLLCYAILVNDTFNSSEKIKA